MQGFSRTGVNCLLENSGLVDHVNTGVGLEPLLRIPQYLRYIDNAGVKSGTGVFYQAMPAVGADGRNVMQLIPVQKINGQFVPSQTSLPAVQTVEPQRAVVMNFASAPIARNMSTIQPSNNGVKKQQFNITGTPNPVQGRGHRVNVSQQNYLKQSHASLKPSSAPQVVSPVTHSPKSGMALSLLNTNKMPVTVKSPVLPNGQYLQIPPNAQVKTLPMSALPPGIKKQLFTSAANSPTVLYVSPVTTMNPGSLQPCPTVASSPSTPQKISEQTPCASSSMPSKRSPRTVAKDGSKPVTPIRWIIEEQDGSPAPCLVPVNPSVMASEILKTVAEREKTSKVQEITAENPLSPKTQTKAGQVRDNALVMCNGKVYFVAKKTPELCKLMAKPLGAIGSLSEKPIGKGRSSQGRSFLPSLLLNPSIESQALDKNKSNSKSIVIPDGPDEVIDLCDDDSQDDPTLQAEPTAKLTETDKSQPVTHEDEESNVIFVSYIPPKPIFRFSLHQMKRDLGNKIKAGPESVTSQNTVGEQNLNDTQSSVNVLSEGSCPDIDMIQDVAISTVNATDQALNTSLDNIAGQRMDTCRGTLSSMEVKDSLANYQAVKVLADPSVKETVTSQDVDITAEMAENRAVPSDQQEARNKQPAVTAITDQAVKVLADPSVKETVTSQDVDITPEMAENRAVPSYQQEARNKQPAITSITDQAVKVLADPSVNETVTSQDVDVTPKIAENMTVPSDQQETMNEQPDVTSKDMDSANSNASVQAEKDTNQNQSGLKRMFGITSDVKIILKRIDDVQPEIPPKVLPQIGPISKSALEGIRKLIQGSQINLNKRKHDKTQGCPQESSDECPKDTKMQKNENAPIASPDSDNIKEALISSSPIPNACVVNVSEGSEQKSPCEDIAMTSVEPQCLSTVRETCQSSAREISAVDLFSTTPMDPDEIKRHEKIRRLKELLREKEAALEMLRKNSD
ncbi:ligand-dependent nuclear receptor-interacting factor 1 isoform X1 [Hypomesus transpacificus]|uniref:ligand-dependent nuclear receptor-interacting factor 1 isoform X1 n=1 Tax=Hypomesus transpacificus TaxID=137520 RepID=UPI001F087FDA|nr:ligand-dependent nuclear receptor-interacting factor 1 isoform X1 [Hypomesus transpacificus]